MSGVSVGGDSSIILAAGGGDAFSQRLTSLQAAQKSAEQAQANLHLAGDAVSQWNQSKAALDEARKKLVEATATAAGITANAQASREKMLAEADARIVAASAKAQQILNDAAVKNEEAKTALANAQAQVRAVNDKKDALLADVAQREQAARAALIAAQQTQAEAQAMKEKYATLVRNMRTAMSGA